MIGPDAHFETYYIFSNYSNYALLLAEQRLCIWLHNEGMYLILITCIWVSKARMGLYITAVSPEPSMVVYKKKSYYYNRKA